MIAFEVVTKVNFNRGLFIARMCLDTLTFEQAETLAGSQFLEVNLLFLALVLESFLNQFHKSPLLCGTGRATCATANSVEAARPMNRFCRWVKPLDRVS